MSSLAKTWRADTCKRVTTTAGNGVTIVGRGVTTVGKGVTTTVGKEVTTVGRGLAVERLPDYYR